MNVMEFYDLKARTSKGDELAMDQFKGKAVLIVNTATRCGLAPQFRELEALHQKYGERGLVLIGFPSNQFLNQEPESNDTMEQTCEVMFGVTFLLTEKIKVNGKATHPVFRFLKEQLPRKNRKKIKWNFTKFLITPEGKPYKRYTPTTSPASIEEDIVSILPS